jgi:uncharacterized protein YprB with RNaseH-like and TPR domain
MSPSISDQLKKLGVQVGTENIPAPDKKQTKALLLDFIEGAWESTRHGDCFVIRKSFPINHKHGSVRLSAPLDISPFSTILGINSKNNIQKEHIIFLDTETTGLSGGAGTYVFLVGAAKYDQHGVNFAQFFLQDPAEELSQLYAFDEFTAGAELIVSYNGKSFDLPRIRSRYAFHGLEFPLGQIPHIDLLHIVRRLWKNHLPSCSLGDLEYHILDVKRSSIDIPGWEVSKKFFDYLQTGDPIPLEGVFYHNEIDVISLITLMSYISGRLIKPLSKKYQDNEDLISFGNFLNQSRDYKLASKVLTKALMIESLSADLRSTGLFHLSLIHKRNKDYEMAIPLWEEGALLNDAAPCIELAKYYEHKEKDYQEAISWTLKAIEILDSSSQNTEREKHRLKRLKDKSIKSKEKEKTAAS